MCVKVYTIKMWVQCSQENAKTKGVFMHVYINDYKECLTLSDQEVNELTNKGETTKDGWEIYTDNKKSKKRLSELLDLLKSEFDFFAEERFFDLAELTQDNIDYIQSFNDSFVKAIFLDNNTIKISKNVEFKD